MKRQAGVTLIELLVTLSVAAILMSLAIPSFRETIISNRLTTINNQFIGSINFARSEAIKRGQSVTLCKKVANADTCSTDNAVFWENGWIAFADADADGALDTGETVLQVWGALPAGYTLRSATFTNFLRYNPQGATASTGNFAVCNNSSEANAKAVIITRVRPRLGRDSASDTDTIPETDTANISSCESP